MSRAPEPLYQLLHNIFDLVKLPSTPAEKVSLFLPAVEQAVASTASLVTSLGFTDVRLVRESRLHALFGGTKRCPAAQAVVLFSLALRNTLTIPPRVAAQAYKCVHDLAFVLSYQPFQVPLAPGFAPHCVPSHTRRRNCVNNLLSAFPHSQSPPRPASRLPPPSRRSTPATRPSSPRGAWATRTLCS